MRKVDPKVERLKAQLERYKDTLSRAQAEGTKLITEKRELQHLVDDYDAELNRLTPKVVAAGVIRVMNSGNYLIGKRKRNEILGGYWHWIGGKVHAKELKERAIIREVKEEVGVTVEVGRFITSHLVQYDHGTFDVYFYECTLASDEALKPIGVEEFRVVSLPEILNFNMLAADMFVAKYLLYRNYFHE